MWEKLIKNESMQSYTDDLKFRSISLNWATGGGIKRGRFLNTYGPESSGKSMLAYELIADDLKTDEKKVALIFDAECNLNTESQMEYLKGFGVPVKYHLVDGAIVIDEDSRVQILWKNDPADIFDWTVDKAIPALKENGLRLSVVLVDSMQSLVPPKEANAKKTTDHQMGDVAGYLPKAFRKITLESRKHGTNWIFINQARDDLNDRFGGYTYSGGRAARHGYDYVILLEKINAKDCYIFGEEKDIRGNEVLIGHKVRAKVEKCRLASSYRQAEFDIYYTKGTGNQDEETVDLAIKQGIVKQAGAWVSYGDTKGQGTVGFIKNVTQETIEKIREQVLSNMSTFIADGEKNQVIEGLANEIIKKEKKTKGAA